jgi:uncharacterized protein YjdB
MLPVLAVALVLSACGGGDGPGVIEPPPPDNVAAAVEIVSPAESVQANQTLQLSATVRNAAGVVLSGKTVHWQSASDAIASVTPAGLVTAHGPGRVTLTAIETASGRSGSMSLSVLPAPVATLAITPAALSVHEGVTQPLAATARDANGNVLAGRAVLWSSADATVAAVDAATGVVRGIRAGATTITASSEGKSAVAEVSVIPVPVASLAIEPASISLHPGGTKTLAITARDAAGNVLPGRAVTLVSSNAAVATVSGGVVTAVGTGMAMVEAISEGKTARASVLVTPVPVASLTIDPSSISLHVGGTQALAITARDAAGNVLPGRTVTLTTSNSGVATAPGGVVTAVGVGNATLTAYTEGGQTATATVTVTLVPIASLTIDPSSISLYVGATQTLAVVARDAAGGVLTGRAVTLVSSDASVATVWGDVVTAAGAGSATITATAEGKTATASVGVGAVPVASVVIEPASITLQAGEATMPQVFAVDSAGKRLGRAVTLESSDPSVFTVENSFITGAGVGNATLTATSGGKSATASVTVTRALVAVVDVNPGSMSLLEGAGGVTLTVTARDRWGRFLSGRAVTLVSSDASVASLDGNVVTAVGAGTATITATCEGKTGTASVTVWRDAVNYVTLSPSGFTMKPGTTRQMTATTWGSVAGHVLTGRVVTWSSTEPAVASVNASGLVTGLAEGLTVITATSEGKTASAVVSVGEAARVELNPGFATLGVGASTTLGMAAFTASGHALTHPDVQWASLSGAVAGVNGSGTVTGASAGQVRIVATVDAATDTAVVAVLGPQSLLSTAFAGGQVKAYVRRGQTITVPVVLDLSKVSASGDLGAAQFQLAYDPAVLVYQSASPGVTGTADSNVPAPGTFRFSFAGTNPQGTARLTLVTITFQVAPGAAVGTQRALTLTYTAQPANTSFAKYALPIAISGRVQVVQ